MALRLPQHGQQPAQQCEFLLFGSVSEANHPTLIHRLRGLCDYSSAGGLPFADREITLRIDATNSSAKLHVHQSLDQPESPWIMSYHGQLELGDVNRPTAVRTFISAGCGQNLLDCLKELGFVAHTELILQGQAFKKGQIRITVFKMFQPNDTGAPETARALSPNYLVELSALAASGQDNIGLEMRSFAEHLKPIVFMEKTDGIR